MAEGGTATEVKAPAPTPEAPKATPQPEQKPTSLGHEAAGRVETMTQAPDANVDAILRQVADGTAFKGMDAADRVMQQATGPSTEVAVPEPNPLAQTAEQDVVKAAEALTKTAAATETPTASKELVLAEKPVQQEQPVDNQLPQTETTQSAADVSRGQQLVEMMGVSADASAEEIATAAKNLFEGKDFSEILGVAPDASEQEIKEATRKVFKELHTDINSDARAEEAIKLFTAAKTDYDNQLKTEQQKPQATETPQTETTPVSSQPEPSWAHVVMQPPMREAIAAEEEQPEQAEEKDNVQEFIEQKVKDLVAPEDAKELSKDLAHEVKDHPDLKEPVEEIIEKVATDQNPIQDLEQQAQELQQKITITTETQTVPTKEIGALKIVLEIIQKLIKALITAAGKTKIPVLTTFPRGARTQQGTISAQAVPAAETVRPIQPAIEQASTQQAPDYEVTLERMDQQPTVIQQPAIEKGKQPAIEQAPQRPVLEAVAAKPELPSAAQRPALEAAPKAQS